MWEEVVSNTRVPREVETLMLMGRATSQVPWWKDIKGTGHVSQRT